MPKREPRTEQEAAIQTLLADLSRPAREDIKERFVARFDCELRELPEDRHEEALTWVEDLLIAEEEPPDGSGY